MNEPKDIISAEGHSEADKPGKLETTSSKPLTENPQIKIPGKVAASDNQSATGLTTEAGDGSANTALRRPIAPRPRPKAPARRRGGIWGWIMIGVLAVAAGVGVFFYIRSTQTSTTFQGQTTTVSSRLPVTVSISSSGQIQANADLALTFSSNGTLTKLNKKLGDNVTAGEVVAEIDDVDLQSSLKSAQASYDQQLGSYKKTIEGATQKEMEQAQASYDQSQANLTTTIKGTFTAEEVTSAQAAVNSAAAALNEKRSGGKPYDIASAKAGISSAEAQLASAQATLAKTLAGSDNAAIVSAQATYDQAVASYDKTVSSLKLNVTNAQVARDQALNSLKNAQDSYQATYKDNRDASGKLKDNLAQSAIDKETSAYRSLQDAQGSYNKADAALNDSKIQLEAQTRSLKSQVDNAKAQLDKAKQGPTQADVASAQSSVASAQSSLENAKKTLAALTPTSADIAAAESSLASAQANLAKLRGGTTEEVASSEASLRSAQATLDDLKRGPNPNDIAIAKAQLDVAQINVDKAKTNLTNAVLKSPVSGTIVQAPLTVGQIVASATTIYQVVDLSTLHVDVNVSETDTSKLKEGMGVAVNLDGIPNRSFSGKVTFISSKSTVSNNVTSYLTTVMLDSGSANSLFAAYQGEFNKLLQGGGAGQLGATGGTGGFPGGAPPAGAIPGGGAGFPGGAAGGGTGGISSAQIAAATGICGYSLSSLFNQSSTGQQATPKVGMTASVTFCLNLKAGVLSVPNRAIKTKTENGQRVSYVEVLVDKATSKIEQRPITSGLAGDNYTEITGGNLKEGDLLVLSTTPTNRGTSTGLPF